MRRLRLLALVAGIPLVCFVLMAGIVILYEWDFSDALRDSPEGYGVYEFCVDHASDDEALFDICDTYMDASLLAGVAVVAGVVGVGMLTTIWLTGLIARRSRILLLLVFGLGLPIVNLLVIGLVLVQGAMVLATVYLLEVTLFDMYHPILLLGIGLAAIVAVFGMVRALQTAVRKAHIEVRGVTLSGERHRARGR